MLSFSFLLFALLLSGGVAVFIRRIPSEDIFLRGQRVIRRVSLIAVLLVFMGYALPDSIPPPIAEVSTESYSTMVWQRDELELPHPEPNMIDTTTSIQEPRSSFQPIVNMPVATGHRLESRGYAMMND